MKLTWTGQQWWEEFGQPCIHGQSQHALVHNMLKLDPMRNHHTYEYQKNLFKSLCMNENTIKEGFFK